MRLIVIKSYACSQHQRGTAWQAFTSASSSLASSPLNSNTERSDGSIPTKGWFSKPSVNRLICTQECALYLLSSGINIQTLICSLWTRFLSETCTARSSSLEVIIILEISPALTLQTNSAHTSQRNGEKIVYWPAVSTTECTVFYREKQNVAQHSAAPVGQEVSPSFSQPFLRMRVELPLLCVDQKLQKSVRLIVLIMNKAKEKALEFQ